MNFTINSDALMGDYREVHYYNKDRNENYDHRIFSFVRWSRDEKVIVVSNFDEQKEYRLDLLIPEELISSWKMKEGSYLLSEVLGENENTLEISNGQGSIPVEIGPLESRIFVLR